MKTQLIAMLKQALKLSNPVKRRGMRLTSGSGQTELLEPRVLLSGSTSGVDVFTNSTDFVSYRTTNQNDAAVASNANGDYVVVWESGSQDGSLNGIFGQMYAADGTKVGEEFRINNRTTREQADPQIAMDDVGNFVVVWESQLQDGDLFGIYARQYSALGVAQGSEFRVNNDVLGNQENPDIAMDQNGNFIIAWESENTFTDGSDIFARRYLADGTAQDNFEFRINTTTANEQTRPAVAMSSAGGAVFVWESSDASGTSVEIRGQRMSPFGFAVGTEFRTSRSAATNIPQGRPDVAMDAVGNFELVWDAFTSNGNQHEIYLQRFPSNGSIRPVRQVNSTVFADQSAPAIAMNNAGRFVVTWASFGQDGSGYGIFGRCFDEASRGITDEFRVNATSLANQADPAVTIDEDGEFVVAWEGQDPERLTYDVFHRSYFDTTGPTSMSVSGRGLTISDGDQIPSHNDRTNFGSAIRGGNTIIQTFLIHNTGSNDLVIDSISVPTGYSIVGTAPSLISPGASKSLTVRLETVSAGTKTGDIVIRSNATAASRYNFEITGNVTTRLTNSPQDGVVSYEESSGRWTITTPGLNAYSVVAGPSWSPDAGWTVFQGDFNNDGFVDLAGRQAGGNWYVALNNGNAAFSVSNWGVWNTNEAARWQFEQVADINGDGKDDIIAQNKSGEWWAAVSDGTSFNNQYLGRWNANAYSEVVVGDFNRDGRDDIAGFQDGNGQWWIGLSTGTRFLTRFAGRWNAAAGFHDVQVGDFDGDGKDDLAAQNSGGRWFIGTVDASTQLQMYYAARWGSSRGEAVVGDFNGDGRDDLGSLHSNGSWWISLSQGANKRMLNTYFGKGTSGVDYVVLDVNGDNSDDIMTFNSTTGLWTAALAQNNSFYFHNVLNWGLGRVADLFESGKVN